MAIWNCGASARTEVTGILTRRGGSSATDEPALMSGSSGMCKLATIVATGAVVAVLALGTVLTATVVRSLVVVLALVLVGLRAVADPESRQETSAHADEKTDKTLRHRANTAEREPAGAGGMLDVLHYIADDVDDLCS